MVLGAQPSEEAVIFGRRLNEFCVVPGRVKMRIPLLDAIGPDDTQVRHSVRNDREIHLFPVMANCADRACEQKKCRLSIRSSTARR